MPSVNFGGLSIPNAPPPRFAVDPLERAIKEAQLYNLQQDPRFRERTLTLEALGLQNTQANHEAMLKVQQGQLAETGRHNQVVEGVDVGQLAETGRHNLATEGSTIRGQDLETTRQAGVNQTQVTTSMLHTILNDFANPDNKAIAAETLAKLGYPQLKETLATQPKDAKSAGADEALRRLAGGTTSKTTSTTPTSYDIPSEFANDPMFKALMPVLEKKQAEEAARVNAQQDELVVQKRRNALYQLMKNAGVLPPARPERFYR